jgi:hypothetical protein
MIQQKLDKVLPFFSLTGLFIYFLFENFYTTSFGRNFFFLICLSLVATDIIFRIFGDKSAGSIKDSFKSRLFSGAFGLGSIITFKLREILDKWNESFLDSELSMMPKIQEFLLALTVVFTLTYTVYTLLLEMGRRSLEAQTQLSDKKRGLIQESVLGFLILLPILVAINYISVKRNYNFDLSAQGKYSLTAISRSIVREIRDEVEILAFYPRPLEADGPGNTLALSRIRNDLEIFLSQYTAVNPKISLRFINADVELDALTGIGQVSNGTVLVRSKKKQPSISDPNLYVEDRLTLREPSDLEDLERKLTAAILKVITPKKVAYLTTANGERYSSAFKNLKNEQITTFASTLRFLNFELKELGLAEGWPKPVPEDADIVIVAGPTVPMSETARKEIESYVKDRNGKVWITIDRFGEENLNWLLESGGLRFQRTLLSQTESRPGVIIANTFPPHPSTELLSKKDIGVLLPYSGYFETFSGEGKGFQYLSKFILESGPEAFLDPKENGKRRSEVSEIRNLPVATLLEPLPDLNPTQSDFTGPDERTTEKSGKIFVFSGTSWITDQYIQYNLNRNMVVNTLSWLFQDSRVAEIPDKKDEIQTVDLSDKQKLMVWLLGMFIFPGMIIGIGSYWVISRRKNLAGESYQ